MKQFFIFLTTAILGLLVPHQANLGGTSVILPVQGGTGISTSSNSNVGQCLQVSSSSPFTYTFGACSGGSGNFVTTSINNVVSTSFNFVGAGGLTITTSSNSITFTQGAGGGAGGVNSSTAGFVAVYDTTSTVTGTSKLTPSQITEADPIFSAYPAVASSTFLLQSIFNAYPALATSTFLSKSGGTMTGGLIMTDASSTNFNVSGQLSLNNALSAIYGGTGLNSYTLGDMIYASAANILTQLPGNTSTVQKFLSMTGNGSIAGVPSWQTLPSAGQLTYYWYSQQSTSSPTYFKMLTSPTSTRVTSTYSGLSTSQTLQNFITDPGFPGITFIPQGLFTTEFYASVAGGSGTLDVEFWEVDSNGIDIARIGVTDPTPALTGTLTSYSVNFTSLTSYLMASSSSRIVARLTYNRTAGTGTVTIVNGNGSDSRVALPSNTVDATHFVPYTGATADVNLGNFGVSSVGTSTFATTTMNNQLHVMNFMMLHATTRNSPAPAGTIQLHATSTNGFTRLEMDNEGATNFLYPRDFGIFEVRNNSGVTLNTGQAVYIVSSTANLPRVKLALANSTSTLPAIGLVLDPISAGAVGEVMEGGIIQNVKTSDFSTGDQLYVSTTVAGGLTNVRPKYPNIVQRVGTVGVADATAGTIEVVIAPFLGGIESGTIQPFTAGNGLTVLGSLALPNNSVTDAMISSANNWNGFLNYPSLATSSFLGVGYPALATSSFLGVGYPALATSTFLAKAFTPTVTSTYQITSGGVNIIQVIPTTSLRFSGSNATTTMYQCGFVNNNFTSSKLQTVIHATAATGFQFRLSYGANCDGSTASTTIGTYIAQNQVGGTIQDVAVTIPANNYIVLQGLAASSTNIDSFDFALLGHNYSN